MTQYTFDEGKRIRDNQEEHDKNEHELLQRPLYCFGIFVIMLMIFILFIWPFIG